MTSRTCATVCVHSIIAKPGNWLLPVGFALEACAECMGPNATSCFYRYNHARSTKRIMKFPQYLNADSHLHIVNMHVCYECSFNA